MPSIQNNQINSLSCDFITLILFAGFLSTYEPNILCVIIYRYNHKTSASRFPLTLYIYTVLNTWNLQAKMSLSVKLFHNTTPSYGWPNGWAQSLFVREMSLTNEELGSLWPLLVCFDSLWNSQITLVEKDKMFSVGKDFGHIHSMQTKIAERSTL